MYDAKGAIHWTHSQDEARAALVAQWAKDSAADPDKSRFVFAYTNADVDRLNADIRAVRKERGELGAKITAFRPNTAAPSLPTRDRIQITGTDKGRGLTNGAAGTIESIEGDKIAVRLDGRGDKRVEFDAKEFQDFRHGYAGTIYKGQGRTLDQTYLYHSEHWRSAASYVALTRHRDKAELFVARETAEDVKQLARQMARVDDRRAASHFYPQGEPAPVRPLTPQELPEVELPAKQPEAEKSRPLDWTQSPRHGSAAASHARGSPQGRARRPARAGYSGARYPGAGTGSHPQPAARMGGRPRHGFPAAIRHARASRGRACRVAPRAGAGQGPDARAAGGQATPQRQ